MCSTKGDSDESIAERFRQDYNEQFHILIRMHLSFLLDSNTHGNGGSSEKSKLRKWNIPYGKKLKVRGVIERTPLTQEGISQIYQLIEYLKLVENLKTEGIFRRTGSLERQQDLRNLLSQGGTLQLEEGIYSVHDCACVLKGILAELPDPLMTEAHFPIYCQIAESCGLTRQALQEEKLLSALQFLLLVLPPDNKALLKDILELLHLTASHETENRMSCDNLAKIFTPHLLCPRKLSPETLLKDSQTLFQIVSFMIKNFSELFKIPPKLILEFRAKYARNPDTTVSDAASTVYTFVDQERTAKENESNPTEKALAQLYAHIQSLPESSKKRKLVKQFNKENGHGTPLQVPRSGPKNKSLGDSIKKHIFQKGLVKRKRLTDRALSSEDILNTPVQSPSIKPKTRLFCHHNTDSSTESLPAKRPKQSGSDPDSVSPEEKDDDSLGKDSSIEETNRLCNIYLTSTPACVHQKACPEIVFTPEEQDRKSMSPITRSTQRMTRAMQETMMTPRSRKPVLLVSGTSINTITNLKDSHPSMDDLTEEGCISAKYFPRTSLTKSKSESDILEMKPERLDKMNRTDSPSTSSSLSDTFKAYLSNRDILTVSSPGDSSFSSRTDDFNSMDFQDLSGDKMSDSLLYCLNGNRPHDVSMTDLNESAREKEPVLKPKQFDENGKAIIFETSF